MRTALAITVVVVLLAFYSSWVAGRLDRMHRRTEGALAAMDAALVRRAAAAVSLAAAAERAGRLDPADARAVEVAAAAARTADGAQRHNAENDLTHALFRAFGPPEQDPPAALVPVGPGDPLRPEVVTLADACGRLVIARRFYNDATRRTRSARNRRIPRWFRLAGSARLPEAFEIDDRPPAVTTVEGAVPGPR